jgi:peptidoglycan hydrolase-like protein with peptidoglycan-binding domain
MRKTLSISAIPLLATLVAAAPHPLAMAQGVVPLTFVQPLAPAAVRAVQQNLHDLGSYAGPVDGQWGPDSQQALVRFQESHGLQPTGQLNQGTLVSLGLDQGAVLGIAPPPLHPYQTTPGLNAAAIRNIEDRLKTFGYYNGAVDGLWGPNIEGAVRDFQEGRGLQPSGQVTPATVAALGLDPNNPAELR